MFMSSIVASINLKSKDYLFSIRGIKGRSRSHHHIYLIQIIHQMTGDANTSNYFDRWDLDIPPEIIPRGNIKPELTINKPDGGCCRRIVEKRQLNGFPTSSRWYQHCEATNPKAYSNYRVFRPSISSPRTGHKPVFPPRRGRRICHRRTRLHIPINKERLVSSLSHRRLACT